MIANRKQCPANYMMAVADSISGYAATIRAEAARCSMVKRAMDVNIVVVGRCLKQVRCLASGVESASDAELLKKMTRLPRSTHKNCRGSNR